MDWVTTVVCWENIFHGITTVERVTRIMKVLKIKKLMDEIQVIVIYRDSEMCLNMKWISSEDMPSVLVVEEVPLRYQI